MLNSLLLHILTHRCSSPDFLPNSDSWSKIPGFPFSKSLVPFWPHLFPVPFSICCNLVHWPLSPYSPDSLTLWNKYWRIFWKLYQLQFLLQVFPPLTSVVHLSPPPPHLPPKVRNSAIKVEIRFLYHCIFFFSAFLPNWEEGREEKSIGLVISIRYQICLSNRVHAWVIRVHAS